MEVKTGDEVKCAQGSGFSKETEEHALLGGRDCM